MKQLKRRYGIGPCISYDGAPAWALFEVDATGNPLQLCASHAERKVLVKAIAHMNGIFDDHIEWIERGSMDQASAKVLSLVPPSNRAS